MVVDAKHMYDYRAKSSDMVKESGNISSARTRGHG